MLADVLHIYESVLFNYDLTILKKAVKQSILLKLVHLSRFEPDFKSSIPNSVRIE